MKNRLWRTFSLSTDRMSAPRRTQKNHFFIKFLWLLNLKKSKIGCGGLFRRPLTLGRVECAHIAYLCLLISLSCNGYNLYYYLLQLSNHCTITCLLFQFSIRGRVNSAFWKARKSALRTGALTLCLWKNWKCVL